MMCALEMSMLMARKRVYLLRSSCEKMLYQIFSVSYISNS